MFDFISDGLDFFGEQSTLTKGLMIASVACFAMGGISLYKDIKANKAITDEEMAEVFDVEE